MKMKLKPFIYALILIANILFGEWISFNEVDSSNNTIKVINCDEYTLTLEVSLPGIEIYENIINEIIYHNIELPNYYSTLEIGYPQLPAIRELIAVPEYANYNMTFSPKIGQFEMLVQEVFHY